MLISLIYICLWDTFQSAYKEIKLMLFLCKFWLLAFPVVSKIIIVYCNSIYLLFYCNITVTTFSTTIHNKKQVKYATNWYEKMVSFQTIIAQVLAPIPHNSFSNCWQSKLCSSSCASTGWVVEDFSPKYILS